mgnify:CR=1 FL=1
MITCRKCGSADLFVKKQSMQTGLYCGNCGAWQKWIGKEELRVIERQIHKGGKADLSQYSNEELLQEIGRRLKD